MQDGPPSDKPHGKEAVVNALLEAAIPLIAERGVQGVSFRDIAAAANVNHGLITRHFKTKEALMSRVGDRLGQRLFETAYGTAPPPEGRFALVVRDHRTELRAIVRILLETSSTDRESGPTSPFVGQIVQWARGTQAAKGPDAQVDPGVILFATAALVIGGEILEPHFQRLLGLDSAAVRDLWTSSYRLFRPAD